MQFDQVLGNRQPQPRALFAIGGVADLTKFFEDGRLRRRWNAAPGVADAE